MPVSDFGTKLQGFVLRVEAIGIEDRQAPFAGSARSRTVARCNECTDERPMSPFGQHLCIDGSPGAVERLGRFPMAFGQFARPDAYFNVVGRLDADALTSSTGPTWVLDTRLDSEPTAGHRWKLVAPPVTQTFRVVFRSAHTAGLRECADAHRKARVGFHLHAGLMPPVKSNSSAV
ncbi:MAG: hypothetical protein ACJAXA_002104 [Candidatus Aldehydirespiratoraceae bacterium]